RCPMQATGTLFRIRVAGDPGAYLLPQDARPLCHPAVDRALQLSAAGGPPHVGLTVEWDLGTKERLFGSVQEEAVQDADSVRLQQQAHQQHSCTLDECFQLYTKEEQVGAPRKPRAPRRWGLVSGRSRAREQEVQQGRAAGPCPGAAPACPCCGCQPAAPWAVPPLRPHEGDDDSTVEGVREDEVSTRSAYILFYQRRNAIPAWSASSAARGSSSSSLSDHWVARLGGSKRDGAVGQPSAPHPSPRSSPE
ncbi:UBP43 hydrolase, partial [Alectura lathami]|nr:UBP43 hydrolase [Alectura lathami]